MNLSSNKPLGKLLSSTFSSVKIEAANNRKALFFAPLNLNISIQINQPKLLIYQNIQNKEGYWNQFRKTNFFLETKLNTATIRVTTVLETTYQIAKYLVIRNINATFRRNPTKERVKKATISFFLLYLPPLNTNLAFSK